MKKHILVFLSLILSVSLKSQTVYSHYYSICLDINDAFPNNLVNNLNKLGFILLSTESTDEEIKFNFTLKKYDKYYYHVTISKIGGMQQVVLIFNKNSKKTEYDTFIKDIRDLMALQPKLKQLPKAQIYKDNSGNFFIIEDEPFNNDLYMITILNYNALYELYLKL